MATATRDYIAVGSKLKTHGRRNQGNRTADDRPTALPECRRMLTTPMEAATAVASCQSDSLRVCVGVWSSGKADGIGLDVRSVAGS